MPGDRGLIQDVRPASAEVTGQQRELFAFDAFEYEDPNKKEGEPATIGVKEGWRLQLGGSVIGDDPIGSLATKDTVDASEDVVGLGSLALKNAVSALTEVTDLGGLALKDTVDAETEVTGLGDLALKSLVGIEDLQTTIIEDNKIQTGLIDADAVLANVAVFDQGFIANLFAEDIVATSLTIQGGVIQNEKFTVSAQGDVVSGDFTANGEMRFQGTFFANQIYTIRAFGTQLEGVNYFPATIQPQFGDSAFWADNLFAGKILFVSEIRSSFGGGPIGIKFDSGSFFSTLFLEGLPTFAPPGFTDAVWRDSSGYLRIT